MFSFPHLKSRSRNLPFREAWVCCWGVVKPSFQVCPKKHGFLSQYTDLWQLCPVLVGFLGLYTMWSNSHQWTPANMPYSALQRSPKNTQWKGSIMNWRREKMNPDEKCGNIHMDSSWKLDEEEMNGSAFILVLPGALDTPLWPPQVSGLGSGACVPSYRGNSSSPPDTEQVQQPTPLSKIFQRLNSEIITCCHHWMSRECPGCPTQQMPNSCTGCFFVAGEEKQPSKGIERLLREKLLSNFKGKIFRELWINELISKQVPCFYR